MLNNRRYELPFSVHQQPEQLSANKIVNWKAVSHLRRVCNCTSKGVQLGLFRKFTMFCLKKKSVAADARCPVAFDASTMTGKVGKLTPATPCHKTQRLCQRIRSSPSLEAGYRRLFANDSSWLVRHSRRLLQLNRFCRMNEINPLSFYFAFWTCFWARKYLFPGTVLYEFNVCARFFREF